MIETLAQALLHFVESLGYTGIFIMAMIESTFIPVASELTMVPAGYLVYQGKLDLAPVFIASLGGSISGSLINYWIAYRFGRTVLLKHKIFMMNEEKLSKIENFFDRHGTFSVFIGRLAYGVRHYVSFPAGLAKMNLKKFTAYTAMGDALWVSILLTLGYAAGGNEAELHEFLPIIKIVVMITIVSMIALYIYKQKRKRAAQADV